MFAYLTAISSHDNALVIAMWPISAHQTLPQVSATTFQARNLMTSVSFWAMPDTSYRARQNPNESVMRRC